MGRHVSYFAQDTFVSSASPSSVNPSSSVTWVTNGSRVGFIHMNNPAPLGATILSAKLRLRSWTTTASAFVEVRRSQKRPAFSHLTWNNAPAGISGPGEPKEVSKTSGATEWEFDVTSHMQAVSDGAAWYGWRVEATNPSGDVRFHSQDSGAGPVLEVEWSDRPDAPTALSPMGGRVVSVTHPVLTFDVVDVAGDTTLSAVQVQINGTASMSSPAFDSGRVLTSTPRLRLADTSYPGAVQGTTQYWRARAQDGAGLWSDWSNVTSFNYAGRGTLTVTSPSEAGLTISDDTPVVAWNLAGRSQAAYQVIVAWVSWPSKWLWTSGKVTSTATSITVPRGVIKHDDRNFRITVRVWDTLDRVTTPGDPARYQVERDVHFDDDAGVAPVDELYVDSLNDPPEVVLTGTRGTTPDRWMVLRGNEIIHSCDGIDLHVEGDRYEYVDRTAPGMTEARYRLQPVENGVRAWGNPVAACKPDPQYLWLISLDGSLAVPLLDAELEWEPQSQTELLTPLGSRRPVMVRHSLGARTGTVSGRIVTDVPGVYVEAAEHKQTLRQIEAAGQQVRLVSGDENVPAIIYDLNLSPRSFEDRGDVSFSVFQDGELPDEDF